MKTTKLIALACLITLSLQGFAQDEKEKDKRKRNYGTHNSFNIDLGINNVLEDGQSPDESNALYAVKPWGSWYVALKSTNDTHVGGPLHLLWGADVSWYNFKFQDESVRLTEGDNQVEFSQSFGEFSPIKSKLTAAYINLSFVPMLQFGEDDRHRSHWHDWNDNSGFRIGVGGYGGYKIASYTKVVVEQSGDKEKNKDHDGFFLNNWRYGIRLQAGYRGMDIFVNYDVSDLFAEGRGPELNAFSFGVVL
ncbi:MAG: hypothetical protein R3345_08055 [Fulvivirga sp.]|nr:hypothetical protein [Fulvivirga sp.]